jgi:hypothetical protein
VYARIKALREKLGPAGFTLAIIAMVFALAGGAYAASGGLNSKQKKEVKAIAKSFAGKDGEDGAPGANGAKGDRGEPGNNGTSVTGVDATAGECPNGGVKYTSASGDNAVCNGEDGETGFTETLPAGKTETGTWAVAGTYASTVHVYAPLSFSIPLSEVDAEEISEEPEPFVFPHIHVLAVGVDETTECPGTALDPQAVAGNICVYTTQASGYFPNVRFVVTPEEAVQGTLSHLGVSTSGAIVLGISQSGGAAALEGVGAWAVTAPE